MNVLGMPDDVERCYKLIDSPKHVRGDVTCCDHLLGESAPVEWWIFRFRNAKQPARTSGHVCAPAHGGTWRDIRVPHRAPAKMTISSWHGTHKVILSHSKFPHVSSSKLVSHGEMPPDVLELTWFLGRLSLVILATCSSQTLLEHFEIFQYFPQPPLTQGSLFKCNCLSVLSNLSPWTTTPSNYLLYVLPIIHVQYIYT